MQDLLNALRDKKELAQLGGGTERIDKEHKKGKLTARERLELLLDAGSFEELDMLKEHRSFDLWNGDPAISGRWGHNGLWQDSWSAGLCFCPGFHCFWRFAVRNPCRKNLQNHGFGHGKRRSGHRTQRFGRRQDPGRGQFFGGLCRYIFQKYRCLRSNPSDQRYYGPCAGGAVYSPAITDFIMMVENTSYMFVTGPNVVKR
jgi:propionyl-CoA carboxylase beta chain